MLHPMEGDSILIASVTPNDQVGHQNLLLSSSKYWHYLPTLLHLITSETHCMTSDKVGHQNLPLSSSRGYTYLLMLHPMDRDSYNLCDYLGNHQVSHCHLFQKLDTSTNAILQPLWPIWWPISESFTFKNYNPQHGKLYTKIAYQLSF